MQASGSMLALTPPPALQEALNVLDRIAFVTSYISQPCMQALAAPNGEPQHNA